MGMNIFPEDFANNFIRRYGINIEEAKFEIGQKIIFNVSKCFKLGAVFDFNAHTILAVNLQEKDVIEYMISDFSFLVYEEELEAF